jgi:hypothetical protein
MVGFMTVTAHTAQGTTQGPSDFSPGDLVRVVLGGNVIPLGTGVILEQVRGHVGRAPCWRVLVTEDATGEMSQGVYIARELVRVDHG